MINLTSKSRLRTGFAIALVACFAVGCASKQAPILGARVAALAPTVTAVAPVNGATGVPINLAAITATFSEPVVPLSGSASFVVTCAAPCTNPAGSVALDSTDTIATLTLAPSTSLVPNTVYTVTIGGATSAATGLPMTAPYTWQFTTGATADTTRPSVTSTAPATATSGPTGGVPSNTAISATFSKDMAPASINAASFTVTCTAPCTSPLGTVTYAVGTRTAIFTPTTALAANTTYTATVSTAATDLAGNALGGNQAALPAASDYIWTFVTTSAVAPANVTVQSTNPADGATVCPTATINATFNVPSGLQMDPRTVTSATFTVTGPPPNSTPVIASSVVLDTATGRIATFTPASPLTAGATYTVSITGGASGVKDLAVPANTMLAPASWNFTVGPATGSCLAPVPLGSAAPFGTFGGSAGMTNTGIQTVINGDIGTTAVSTAVTGFHDAGVGCTYTLHSAHLERDFPSISPASLRRPPAPRRPRGILGVTV